MAWAPQRPWLTHGTVADNVRIGRPAASDEEIWQALERVGLGRTVAALPLGIDAPLGEDGSGLSAGQRARVALARVIIARRPYVFLDEPTAHLDADTEAVFLRTLRWLAEGSAVVVVAHRPAVAAAADRVLTLPALAVSHNGGSGRLSEPAHAAPSPDRRDVAGDPQDLARDGAAVPRRFGRRTGVLLGVLSVASGVALTATAAWLITRAAQHPPVLVLLVAIVAVRAFGLARPVLRYAERLVSHDAALRMLGRPACRCVRRARPVGPRTAGGTPRGGAVLCRRRRRRIPRRAAPGAPAVVDRRSGRRWCGALRRGRLARRRSRDGARPGRSRPRRSRDSLVRRSRRGGLRACAPGAVRTDRGSARWSPPAGPLAGRGRRRGGRRPGRMGARSGGPSFGARARPGPGRGVGGLWAGCRGRRGSGLRRHRRAKRCWRCW